jgi:hypothetical protein
MVLYLRKCALVSVCRWLLIEFTSNTREMQRGKAGKIFMRGLSASALGKFYNPSSSLSFFDEFSRCV